MVRTGYVQGTYRLRTGYVQVTYRLRTGYVHVAYRLHTGYIQVTYRLHTGYIQVTYRLRSHKTQCNVQYNLLSGIADNKIIRLVESVILARVKSFAIPWFLESIGWDGIIPYSRVHRKYWLGRNQLMLFHHFVCSTVQQMSAFIDLIF